MEWMMWQADEAMPVHFSTTARIRGTISADQLHEALLKVRRKHPLLAVRATLDAEGQAWFVSEDVPEFSLRIIEGVQEDDWIQVIGEELLQRFSWETGPLVRFIWLQFPDFSDLITICHHAIADGFSGAYLIRDVLHYLGYPEAEVEALPALPALIDLVPPAIEESFSKYSSSDIMAQLALSTPTGELSSPVEQAPPGPPKFCIKAWSLTQAQTAALVACARQEQTTVHGALGAAFLLTFADILGVEEEWMRTLQSPVSLREYLAEPVGEAVGMFITLAKTRVDCTPGRDFWQIARELRAGFARETTPEKLFAMFVVLKSLLASGLSSEVMAENMIKMAEFFTKIDYDLSLSNLGWLDLPTTYGSLELESLYGPTFSAMAGEKIVGVNTMGGRMFFTLIYRDTTLTAPIGEQIRQQVMHRLGEAVGW
jgi:hypothetical protein